MPAARTLLCFIVTTWIAANAQVPKIPEPYRALADLARSAPPEFTADALLHIVEQSDQSRLDKNARRELIEEAFRAASTAKFPVRMQGVAGTTTDTASGSLSRAYDLKLDALSLESRAVRDMLPLDPAAARKMFTEIARPMLAPLTCDDALVYDLSDFYQALSAVVNAAFSTKERAKDDQLNFVLDYLGQATSPLEFAPLAAVIQTVSGTAAQRQTLWARLGGLIETLQADDRSYTASLQTLGSQNMPELQSSLEKYRQKNHVCEGDAAANSGSQTQKTPKLDPYFQSANSQRLVAPGKKLRFDANNMPLSETDRSTPEWQQQLSDYLNQLSDWAPDQESSAADYYHEKSTALTSLIDLAPAGPESDAIIADYVSFVANSDLYQQSPAEWYLEPETLLERFRPGTPLRDKLLDAYEKSGNPVLSLKVALERASRR
jgi:hypothetical protein